MMTAEKKRHSSLTSRQVQQKLMVMLPISLLVKSGSLAALRKAILLY